MVEFKVTDGKFNRPPENDSERFEWVRHLVQGGAITHAETIIAKIQDEGIRENARLLLNDEPVYLTAQSKMK